MSISLAQYAQPLSFARLQQIVVVFILRDAEED
jgi:hypothetical protein